MSSSWDFSDSNVTFDDPGFTFGGISPLPPAPPPPLVPAQPVSTINHTTWLLDWETGDSCLDANGNIAVASAPYSIAQDVATQMSTFLGECWYDTTQGIPYWQQILGKRPPASLLTSLFEAQALLVPDVATATATIGGVNAQRGAIAQMVVTDTDGITTTLPL
jgi:hypothetical protein